MKVHEGWKQWEGDKEGRRKGRRTRGPVLTMTSLQRLVGQGTKGERVGTVLFRTVL